jgi:serine/threonine-protein kinase
MSPEQVLGRPLDGRSDLYSAAIVLYETIAGRPPFLPSEKSEFALRMDQVETPHPPIRSFVPVADVAVEQCMWKALHKDPNQRFQSAIEMGEAFRSAFGIPSTPEWRALGEYAAIAREGSTLEPVRAQKLATLRHIVAQAYRTQPLNRRP